MFIQRVPFTLDLKEAGMYKHILIPTDGSKCSEEAVKQGLAFAKELGAEVTFLYAVEDPAYDMPRAAPYRQPFHDYLTQEAELSLKRAKTWADEAGVSATTQLVDHQPPIQAIHDAEKDYDLIVMGTHGRRGFNRFAFGSVAEGVLRRSEKPCLVIHSSSA
jgi:nucleotide-binding universal stress UspA family protein